MISGCSEAQFQQLELFSSQILRFGCKLLEAALLAAAAAYEQQHAFSKLTPLQVLGQTAQ